MSCDSAVAERPAPNSFEQLGTAAGEQYQGAGLSVTSTPEAARLRCAFQKLEAEVTPEGLWLESTALGGGKLRFVAQALGREVLDCGSPLPLWNPPAPTESGRGLPQSTALARMGTISVEDKLVRLLRPGLTEEYSVSVDGVRQDFIIATRPAGEGLLRVELAVDGATAEPMPGGARLVLENSGRKIAYSRLRVTDATGKELPARLEVESNPDTSRQTLEGAGPLPLYQDDPIDWLEQSASGVAQSKTRSCLAMLVEDADAVYPVRIDPTFSDANWISMGMLRGTPDVVNAAVMDGSGNLYFGGNFTLIGDAIATRVAKWDGSHWSALGLGLNGEVRALAVSGNDVYAGGFFTWATNSGGAAVTVNYIAKWDGSHWAALGAGMKDYVYALAVSGTDVYAGGAFRWATNSGGVAVTVNRIAKWNGSSWSPLGAGMNDTVLALAVSGSDVYAGGTFTWATNSGGAAVSANQIAKWDGNSWTAVGAGMSGYVNSLAASGTNVYVGGSFTTAGGNPANCIAKWDGSAWTALGGGLDNSVSVLTVSGSGVYAGGTFTWATNSAGAAVTVNGIAKWDGSNWSALGSGMNNEVRALAVSASNVYAGGWFLTAINSGGAAVTVDHMAKWDGSSWSAFGSGLEYAVGALAVSGGVLYAGGSLPFAGSSATNYFAKWDGSSWLALGAAMNGSVEALAVSGTNLYAGGQFTMAGDSAANCIAQWDGTSWTTLGAGLNGEVVALAASGSDLYVGGGLTWATNSGGAAVMANYIAKWDGSGWSALGAGLNGYVLALAVSGTNVYAGGSFTWATNSGGAAVAANYIAKWDGSNWSALGSGMNNEVRALAVSGSDLYAGGWFRWATNSGGAAVTANYIAKWNGSNWAALGAGLNNYVYSLAASGSDLYAGGGFTRATNSGAAAVAANAVARWDGSSWTALGSGITHNNTVAALAVSGGDLYAGGNFTVAGGKVSAYVARALVGPQPILLVGTAAEGTNFLFWFQTVSNQSYTVQYNDDLSTANWLFLQGLTGDGTLLHCLVPMTNSTHRFFRVRQP